MDFLAELGVRLVRPILALAPRATIADLSKDLRRAVLPCAIARRGNLA
jgi:hypothetical protein